MTAKKQAKKEAPAKAGAKKEPAAKKAAGKRAKQSKRSPTGEKMTLDEFYAQYGKGYNKLQDFLDEWDLHRTWPDDPMPDNVERLHEHVGRIAKAIRGYMEHEFKSLDDALQVRRPDDYRRPAARKRQQHMEKLQEVGLKLRTHGAVVDRAFFEFLGNLFEVGKTTAEDWYYLKHRGTKPDPAKDKSSIQKWARDQLNWKS